MKFAVTFVMIICCTFLQSSFCEEKEWRAQVEQEVKDLKSLVQSLVEEIRTIKLSTNDDHVPIDIGDSESIQNGTIEERVTLLELQVGDLTGDLEAVEDEVTFVTSGQLIQDQRILELEIDADGTVAFQAEIGLYESIPIDSVVIYNQVDLNLGDGFNIQTGEFTVPSGGAGLYFLCVNFITDFQERVGFDVRVNQAQICRAYADVETSGAGDRANPSCGVVITLSEGDLVDVYYYGGTDDTPVLSETNRFNTFTGFLIAPQ